MGRDLLPDVKTEFGELLRACDAVDGIERIRFTSPHPKDFREPVIAAMAECAAVCEQVHLPLQSGSTRLLKAMRRTYSRERYVALVERMRDAIPDLAFGTDIIVGFPGETEGDFRETLEVVEEVGYDSAYTFVYSPRNGTEAAVMPDQVPHEVKTERMERLVELDTADGPRAERGPGRTDRGGARRGAVAHRSLRAARPDAAQHDGHLHRQCCAGRARPRSGRLRNVDDPARDTAGSRRSLNVSITLFRQD